MMPRHVCAGPAFFRLLRMAWFAAALCMAAPSGAETAKEYAIKASFMAKFMPFIDWPDSVAGDSAAGPFVVAVLGGDPFRGELERAFRPVSIAGRRVAVRNIGSLDEAGSCGVLFVAGSEEGRVEEAIRWANRRGVLIIGDGDGFAEKGVHINFFVNGEKVRFEINAKAAEKSGYQISSLLLKVARIVGS